MQAFQMLRKIMTISEESVYTSAEKDYRSAKCDDLDNEEGI